MHLVTDDILDSIICGIYVNLLVYIHLTHTHTPSLKEYTGSQYNRLPVGREIVWLGKTAKPYVPSNLMYDGSKQFPSAYIYFGQLCITSFYGWGF